MSTLGIVNFLISSLFLKEEFVLACSPTELGLLKELAVLGMERGGEFLLYGIICDHSTIIEFLEVVLD